jgi:hypothetical protein
LVKQWIKEAPERQRGFNFRGRRSILSEGSNGASSTAIFRISGKFGGKLRPGDVVSIDYRIPRPFGKWRRLGALS